jgi:hypothetical protein
MDKDAAVFLLFIIIIIISLFLFYYFFSFFFFFSFFVFVCVFLRRLCVRVLRQTEDACKRWYRGSVIKTSNTQESWAHPPHPMASNNHRKEERKNYTMDGWNAANGVLTALTSPVCSTILKRFYSHNGPQEKRKKRIRRTIGRGDGSFLSYFCFLFLFWSSSVPLGEWPQDEPLFVHTLGIIIRL